MVKKSRHKRNQRGYSDRLVDTRDPVEKFLIVCEGERTEENYFKSFRVLTRPKVIGLGYDPLALVNEALLLQGDDNYDQVWCVFDRDSVARERFNQAIAKADSNNIRVAYSNEAFELWYLLHFVFCDSALHRAEYIPKLGQHLGRSYRKNSETTYEDLKHRQQDAIRNAETLLNRYPTPNPESDNPSTTVHLLVKE